MGSTEVKVEPLIPGLADDVALICLARVPRRYHHLLQCVCKRWKSLTCSDEFLSYRQQNNLQECWIYVICRDKTMKNCCFVMDPSCRRRRWRPVRDLPPWCEKRVGMCFEQLGRKLYVMGGCKYNDTDEVYSYDASLNAWEQTSPMLKARSFFISTILDDTLCVADCAGTSSTMARPLETYHPISQTWVSNGDYNVTGDLDKFVTLHQKIYTIHGFDGGLRHAAAVYDPNSKIWRHLDNHNLSLCWRGPTVVVDGTLYMVDELLGIKLLMWQEEREDWTLIGRLSSLLMKSPCKLAAVGRKIFAVGKGLTTVVIDVDLAAKCEGMLVGSSLLPELDSELVVLSCKTIAI